MERKVFKRFLILTMTTAALLFTGCVNDVNNTDLSDENETKIVEIGGALNLTGALPAELIDSLFEPGNDTLTGQSRTAYPGIPSASALTYTITAKNTETDSTEAYTGAVSGDNKSYYVGIPVTDTERNFKVYVSVTQNGAEILSGVSSEFAISNSTRTKSDADITLAPAQTSGKKGCFSLAITAVSSTTGINSAKMECEGSTITPSKSGNVYTFKNGSVTDGTITNGLSSGAHTATFTFYSGSSYDGTVLYAFTTTINIFDFMTTNTWISNGNEPYFVTTISGGVKTTSCTISKNIINDFGMTDIYVDSTKQTANSSNTATYTTASGTFMNPVTDLASAIAKLKNKDADYKIWIKGTLTGNQSIGTSLKKDGTGTYNAKSLTICGSRGLSSGVPQDVLDGNNSGTVLKIETVVPVTLKNLKITKGAGGGIQINAGCDVTLDSGVLITTNTTTSYGAGVQNSGTLIIKDGATISSNTATNNYGGGIYNYGTVLMEGGEIKNNSAKYGGGVYNQYNGTITGSVGTFIMSGGTISSNTATTYGGAFYMYSGKNDDSFTIRGSAYIPSGSSNTNDIYLAEDKRITINSSLSRHTASNQIAITPAIYKFQYSLRSVSPLSTQDMKEESKKFKCTATSVPNKYFGFDEDGYLNLIFDKFTSASDISGYTSSANWNYPNGVFISDITCDAKTLLFKTSSGNYGVLKVDCSGGSGDYDYYLKWIVFRSGTKYSDSANFNISMGQEASISYQYDLDKDSSAKDIELSYDDNAYVVTVETIGSSVGVYLIP